MSLLLSVTAASCGCLEEQEQPVTIVGTMGSSEVSCNSLMLFISRNPGRGSEQLWDIRYGLGDKCFLPVAACKKVLHVVVIGRPHSSSDRVLKPLQRHHGAPTSLFQASGVCFWTPGSAEQNCIDYVWQKAEARPNRESLCGLDECEFQRR